MAQHRLLLMQAEYTVLYREQNQCLPEEALATFTYLWRSVARDAIDCS